MSEKAIAETIAAGIKLFYEAPEVLEIRIPYKRSVHSGYFSDYEKMVESVLKYDGKYPGLYFTVNPPNPALVARGSNRIVDYAEAATKDNDIVKRNWFPIDIDPVRPTGISSTDQEHEGAIEAAHKIKKYLQDELGFPKPIIVDSGNGTWLFFKVELPNDKNSETVIKNALAALQSKFGNECIVIDQSISNAARIAKLPGTMVCKGDNTPERPHRRSKVLYAPAAVVRLDADKLQALANLAPRPVSKTEQPHEGSFDLIGFMARHGIKVKSQVQESDRIKYVLEQCPFDPEHNRGESAIFQYQDGRLGFKCMHNSCTNYGWKDLRHKFEPKKNNHNEEETDPDEEKPKKKSAAQELITLAEHLQFFHDKSGTAYVIFPVDTHVETAGIRSSVFRSWLTRAYYLTHKKPPGAQSLQDALGVIEARAQFDGKEEEVAIRVGFHGGKIYIDLGQPDWSVVEITDAGYRIIQKPPVRFRRAKTMQALPTPIPGGDINELWTFVNVKDQADQKLLIAASTYALSSPGPFPIVCQRAGHGNAKSTASRIFKALIDPAVPSLRTPPREERDLLIAAHANWLLSFDNVSQIPRMLSDSLCRLATGSGLGTRTLYANDEETVFESKRPIYLNGIEDVITEQDLIDRAIIISLPPIEEDQRVEEKVFWGRFEEAYARLFGAFIDVISRTMKARQDIKLKKVPRMADYAAWGVGVEKALEWEEGSFLAAYSQTRESAIDIGLEDSPVAQAIFKFFKDKDIWTGTLNGLLAVLDPLVEDKTRKSDTWPKKPTSISNILRSITNAMKSHNIEIDLSRRDSVSRKRIVQIKKTEGLDPSNTNKNSDLDPEDIRRASEGTDNNLSSDPSSVNGCFVRDSEDTEDPDGQKPPYSYDMFGGAEETEFIEEADL